VWASQQRQEKEIREKNVESMKPASREGSRSSREVGEIVLTLVNHLDAMVAYWDADQVCVFANDAYRHWFGRAGAELVGMTLEALLGPLYAKNLPFIRAAYQGQVQVFEREIPLPGGGSRHSLATYTPHIVDGKVQGIFVHVADVSPLKTLENELRAAKAKAEVLATHDFLTGLPNRVLLEDRVAQAIALSRRSQRMVAGISLDLDDFKRVNDTYGHTVGDQLLAEVASRIRHCLREADTVTRMGGDEFFLLLPDVFSRAHVEGMAARVMGKVRSPFQAATITIEPACSLGIALYSPASVTRGLLIDGSDRALNRAKKLGKNRYAFADEGPAP
jgi:diguanylate cyclase (GGDEF)-like protein/PAS domain S-box-containing protein